MPVTFLVAFSAVFGAAEAIRQTQSSARKKEHRSRKNNLIVHCRKSSLAAPVLEGRHVVLSGEKLYVDTGEEYNSLFGHTFAGYFLPYPDSKHSGLVSTISDDPPIMNWIYVDASTYEVKFGTRPYAQPNLTGPFDCTRQDRRLTFGGWEGFYAVDEGGFWALYFDVDGDGLKSKIKEGVPVVEVDLMRIEMRVKPPTRDAPEGQGANAQEKEGAEGTRDGVGAKAGGGDGEGLESPEVD